MKLVIEIPEEIYKQAKEDNANHILDSAWYAIASGKPLPLIEDVDNCDSQYAINIKNQWNTVFKEEGAE